MLKDLAKFLLTVSAMFVAITSIYNKTKRKVIPKTKFFIAYETYFGTKMGDQDKSWAPHFCCGSCRSTLEEWMCGSRKCMPFAILRIWREPTNHHDDCYLCMVDIPNTKRQRTGKRLFIQVFLPLFRLSTIAQNCLPSTSNNACHIINLIGR